MSARALTRHQHRLSRAAGVSARDVARGFEAAREALASLPPLYPVESSEEWRRRCEHSRLASRQRRHQRRNSRAMHREALKNIVLVIAACAIAWAFVVAAASLVPTP